MLIRLRESRIGCHINNVSTGALANADDVAINCPSLRGLNKMLDICYEYAAANHIYFDSIKTVCIKYGDPVMEYEKSVVKWSVFILDR